MIGYVIEQELGNLLPPDQPLAAVLTMIEVDPDDPAFTNPTKPDRTGVRPRKPQNGSRASGWRIAADGAGFRRVVAIPKPKRIFEIRAIRSLVERGVIVICAGGGGIPTMYDDRGKLHADLLVIATDVDGVYRGWDTSDQLHVGRMFADEVATLDLPPRSMGPKVEAACRFARRTGNEIVAGNAGTRVTSRQVGSQLPRCVHHIHHRLSMADGARRSEITCSNTMFKRSHNSTYCWRSPATARHSSASH